MNTITHALLPIIAVRAATGRRFSGWQYAGIGLCGALPDLINPHLSLSARMSSWSHGLPAWIAMTILCLVLVPLSRRRWRWDLALIGSLAYLWHLFCDAIAGGINWLSPFGVAYWGEYWFPVVLWTLLDALLLFSAYLVFRVVPGLRAAKSSSKRVSLET
jgi:hypothetical protein